MCVGKTYDIQLKGKEYVSRFTWLDFLTCLDGQLFSSNMLRSKLFSLVYNLTTIQHTNEQRIQIHWNLNFVHRKLYLGNIERTYKLRDKRIHYSPFNNILLLEKHVWVIWSGGEGEMSVAGCLLPVGCGRPWYYHVFVRHQNVMKCKVQMAFVMWQLNCLWQLVSDCEKCS